MWVLPYYCKYKLLIIVENCSGTFPVGVMNVENHIKKTMKANVISRDIVHIFFSFA
jgi:hypothetical protein